MTRTRPDLTVPPTARTLQWVCAAVGDSAEVVAVRPLTGSTTAALHAVRLRTGSGPVRELVLRRYVWAEYLASEGDPPGYETAALRLLAGSLAPAPELVAADAEAAHCDAPAVLMTRLPGRPVHAPGGMGLDRFLRGLAGPLPLIHAVPLAGEGGGLRPYRPYLADRPLNPPWWARRHEVWKRAIDIHLGPIPVASRPRLVHRDYHPGNVLWTRGQVRGVVDWANASAGHPHADVGHCRENLCQLGVEAPDRFLSHYREASGDRTEYLPYWDIAAAVGWAPESTAPPAAPELYEEFVARAVDRAARS
ncbi:aminoglycoside phosphotransferase family protein [Streptomyces antimycoticus]|uniref:phosphotransferase family protein n=1 Tax=Streptomyces antimycoticus TaxID=68175 RepID=UPI00341857FF